MSEFATYVTEPFVPDGLIARNAQLLISEKVTLLSGQSLKRGALVGKITASGKYVLSASAAADGSQAPVAVLAHDSNATAGDAQSLIYTRGDFQTSGITFGTGHTAASTKDALADRGIFLINTQGGV